MRRELCLHASHVWNQDGDSKYLITSKYAVHVRALVCGHCRKGSHAMSSRDFVSHGFLLVGKLLEARSKKPKLELGHVSNNVSFNTAASKAWFHVLFCGHRRTNH